MKQYSHVPVLAKEIVEIAPLQRAKVIIDCTVGLGGHLAEFLKNANKDTLALALDADKHNLDSAKKNLKKYNDRVKFEHCNFLELKQKSKQNFFPKADIIFFDLGLSSVHIDNPKKGFSYKHKGPLDMRFNQESNEITAADILNNYDSYKLRRIFRQYGEEKRARAITEEIIKTRNKRSFTTTDQLSQLVFDLCKTAKSTNQTLKRIFQALRIEVNDELNVLKKALGDATQLLDLGGYIIVISYHSLEDRIVKNSFRSFGNFCHCPKESPICTCKDQQQLEILTRKPIVPSKEELEENPRSRSARLRIAKKIL